MAAERRYSSVGVVRKAEPTPHVEAFRRRLEDYAFELLPDYSQTGRRLAKSLAEQRNEGIEPQVKIIRIPAIKLVGIDNLRVTLDERRGLATKRNNFELLRYLGKLNNELDIDHLTVEVPKESLTVTCHYILESTSRRNFTDSKNRREFSAVIDDSPELRQIHEEARAVQRTTKSERHYSGLKVVDSPDIDTVIDESGLVPLLTLSRWAGNRAINNYIERVNEDGIGAPLVEFLLSRPELECDLPL